MNAFQQIMGHKEIKEYFLKGIKADKIGHSYLFEGPKGVGKKLFAKEFAKILLCEEKEGAPCNQCKSCVMVEKGTHPDYLLVEKDTKVTKIDTIREKLVRNMEIKPYQGNYKIIVIEDADTLTVEGQNAMLKTIEEPPHYGITILISTNRAKLLPTILSRCILLRFNALSSNEMNGYLEKKGIISPKKEIYAQFAQGSIGKAKELIEEEGFWEKRERAISFHKRLEEADLIQVYDLVKELSELKEDLPELLDFWLLWYRDLAMIKSKGTNHLYYPDYQSMLLGKASKLTYNKISINLELIQKAKRELEQNIYTTFIIENLLLKLKERKK